MRKILGILAILVGLGLIILTTIMLLDGANAPLKTLGDGRKIGNVYFAGYVLALLAFSFAINMFLKPPQSPPERKKRRLASSHPQS